MLECVPNVSEGRDAHTVDAIARSCGVALLDVHRDPDHHRSVFTLAASEPHPVEQGVRALALTVADRVDLAAHTGAHPRFGAVDVVPFVALDPTRPEAAVVAAREFARWAAETLEVPTFLFGTVDDQRRALPDLRRDAFTRRVPDFGPRAPHPRLGAIAVGARPPMVAVNVDLRDADLELARDIARAVRERDGGLPGVRALGFALASRQLVQVSMNLVDLEATGVEAACDEVRRRAEASRATVERVELVGLLPAAELSRTSLAFRTWSGFDVGQTLEARIDAATRRNAETEQT